MVNQCQQTSSAILSGLCRNYYTTFMKISNKGVIQSWSQISDEEIEAFGDDGDFFRQHLLNPELLKLLGNVSGKTILDAGCGTGYLSRILAKKVQR